MTVIPAGFLAAIIANPADDTPRLILADWLDEDGEEARAASIRRGMYDTSPRIFPSGCPASMLFLLDPYGESPSPVYEVVFASAIDGVSYTVSRGFVSAVTCTAADWLTHANTLTAQQPIEEVTLTTNPIDSRPDRDVLARLLVEDDAEHLSWRNPPPAEELLNLLWPGIKFTLPQKDGEDFSETNRLLEELRNHKPSRRPRPDTVPRSAPRATSAPATPTCPPEP